MFLISLETAVVNAVFLFVRQCMLELLIWGTRCLENQRCRSSPLTCRQIWLPQKLPFGLRYAHESFA